ncbi:MAG: helix-turn-helix domain-containing protein [Planctomycetota bacterium]|jgi:y4mF family transcriptional regulator
MMSTLASAVRFHRRKAGLSQAGLARLAGVGKTVVFDIEKGKETVRLKTLLMVLGALNMTLEWKSPLENAYANHARQLAEEPDAEEPDEDEES